MVLVVSEKRWMFGYVTLFLQPILDPKTKIFFCLLVVAVFFFPLSITRSPGSIYFCDIFLSVLNSVSVLNSECKVVFYDVNTNTSNNCPPFNEITIQWM